MTQLLLFRDPCPLVERLGRDFFLQLPERPGIYLMRGPADELLYVGKAKNLRQRLGHYRVANPDRLPRRHLRLLRAVKRIEIQECDDEQAALAHEARLLLALKPRFNRAGTWRGQPRYLACRACGDVVQLAVTTDPESGWRAHGPAGSSAHYLRAALVRLLWTARGPQQSFSQMPAGWSRGHFGEIAEVSLPGAAAQRSLDELFAGKVEEFAGWIMSRTAEQPPLFDQTVILEDLEYVMERFSRA